MQLAGEGARSRWRPAGCPWSRRRSASGEPVAVASMTCRSALRSAHVFALRRSFLSRLYISDAARLRVSKSGSSISSEGARASTRTAVATSSGSRRTTAAGSSSFSVSLTAQGYAGGSPRPQSAGPARSEHAGGRRRSGYRERVARSEPDRGGASTGHAGASVACGARSVRGGRLDGERHVDVLACAVADDGERGLVAGASSRGSGRRAAVAESMRLAVDRDDDVAVLEAGLGGGGAAADGR